MVSKKDVVDGTSREVIWWLGERMKKLRDTLGESMSLNPFLAPALYEFHSLGSLGDLLNLLVSAHLVGGHNTGFGKLVDEKILPKVFGTRKLDAGFRSVNKTFRESCFDEIDHYVPASTGSPSLLSLKASRWTIQLSMAVQLNKAFGEIITNHPGAFKQIVVGVYYGKASDLTDKYDILRGVNRGKNHSVVDLRKHVQVYAGRDFWSWINGGATDTQDWVLEGIIAGLQAANPRAQTKKLLASFATGVLGTYSSYSHTTSGVDWKRLLGDING